MDRTIRILRTGLTEFIPAFDRATENKVRRIINGTFDNLDEVLGRLSAWRQRDA